MMSRLDPLDLPDESPRDIHAYELPTIPGARFCIEQDGTGRWFLMLHADGRAHTLALFRGAEQAKLTHQFLDEAFDQINRVIRHVAEQHHLTINPSTDTPAGSHDRDESTPD